MVPEACWTKPEWGTFSQVERQGPFLFFLQIHAVNMTALFWAVRWDTWSAGMWQVTCARLSTYDIIQVHVGSSLDELLGDLQVALLCCHHQGSLSILEEERRKTQSEERDSYLALNSFQIWLLL